VSHDLIASFAVPLGRLSGRMRKASSNRNASMALRTSRQI